MSLLRLLAVRGVTNTDRAPPPARYDHRRQVSQVWEDGGWVDSWEAAHFVDTKKAEAETGEDSKGQ
jgi:hypothetical protein